MDFKLYEFGDGGEININGGDVESENTLSNAIYLSLFSGDNWYNIYEEVETKDSIEETLNTLLVSSNNLKKLETFINESLNWLLEDGIVDDIETKATPRYDGHINISIITTEPDNINKKYMIIWKEQHLRLIDN